MIESGLPRGGGGGMGYFDLSPIAKALIFIDTRFESIKAYIIIATSVLGIIQQLWRHRVLGGKYDVMGARWEFLPQEVLSRAWIEVVL
jgi:hypothetical protein